MISIFLMTAGAVIIFALGAIHLVYTFWGPKFLPCEPEVQVSMNRVSPIISKETTMWRAWIGFNASHSMGAMLFGLIYGYFAMVHADLLFNSPYLLSVGLVTLGGYFALGRLYWFSIPFVGIGVSLVCYLASIVVFLA